MPGTACLDNVSSLHLHLQLLLHPQHFLKTPFFTASSTTMSSLSLNCFLSAEAWSRFLLNLTLPSLASFAFVPGPPGLISVPLVLEDFATYLSMSINQNFRNSWPVHSIQRPNCRPFVTECQSLTGYCSSEVRFLVPGASMSMSNAYGYHTVNTSEFFLP